MMSAPRRVLRAGGVERDVRALRGLGQGAAEVAAGPKHHVVGTEDKRPVVSVRGLPESLLSERSWPLLASVSTDVRERHAGDPTERGKHAVAPRSQRITNRPNRIGLCFIDRGTVVRCVSTTWQPRSPS